MRMVRYVIQVQQLGLRVGAQKNRLNGMEVILFELNTPESIWWSGCYYGDVQTDLKS